MNQVIHPPAAAGLKDDIALQRIHASGLTYDDICRPVVRSFRKMRWSAKCSRSAVRCGSDALGTAADDRRLKGTDSVVPRARRPAPVGRTPRTRQTDRPLILPVAVAAFPFTASRGHVGPTGGRRWPWCRRRCAPSPGSTGRALLSTSVSRGSCRLIDIGSRSEMAACASRVTPPFVGRGRTSTR